MKNKVAQAIIIAGLSTQVFALELGEFKGTQFSVGGYLKAEGVFNNPEVGDRSFESSASQSRVNIATSRTECSGQVQPDTFLKEFSYSMGDWSPFDECNRSRL
ncbi:hypothetical protein [Marinomonas sp. IMCC 4694]|uniref:hypothetical protein n=1 Tax=Marinomonas sp. IMCC 4694 TaxID=2605432 RepID=UPI001652E0E2|nr:hypothetical protein [Marinomonas sp. IMCC 4694]